MPNTSATGGYLAPVTTPNSPDDGDLDAVFQKAIAGITGLPGNMVRPRWQPVMPKQPEPSTNWCAFGVSLQSVPDQPYIEHDGTGDGIDRLRRHEDILVFCTFYGPVSGHLATLFRDGFYVAQNREEIGAAGISLAACGESRAAPELVNQQWIKRHDIAATFRRQVQREYAVRNIVSAEVSLTADASELVSTINISE